MLRHAWLASCLDEIQFQDPSVPGFDGRLHDDMVKEFQQLDQERLRVAIQRVQHAHARKAIEIRDRHSACRIHWYRERLTSAAVTYPSVGCSPRHPTCWWGSDPAGWQVRSR